MFLAKERHRNADSRLGGGGSRWEGPVWEGHSNTVVLQTVVSEVLGALCQPLDLWDSCLSRKLLNFFGSHTQKNLHSRSTQLSSGCILIFFMCVCR